MNKRKATALAGISSMQKNRAERPAVFLDRDGTINREVNYLRHLEDVELLPGAARAIRILNRSGFLVIVVTNQSGIARGLLDVDMLHRINQEIQWRLQQEGAHVDGWYFCPHHPEAAPLPGATRPYTKECRCRKPAPGMVEQAVAEMEIDLSCSFMVGDSLRDMELAQNCGIPGILVRTGHGEDACRKLLGQSTEGLPRPAAVVEDLLEAAHWIIAGRAS